MNRRSTITISRARFAQLASFVGGAALLMGIIGWVWQGSLNLAVGTALLVGILGIGAWALVTPDEFKAFITGRQVRYSTVSVFSSLLLIGIVALVFVLLQRSAIVLDMTENQRYTLSQQTLDILQRIPRPIRLTGFYSPRALAQRAIDDQFFRLYEDASGGMITREYIDPQEQPALASRFGVTQDAQIFISYLDDNGAVDFGTIARVPTSNTQERDLSEAISRLLIAGTITVYFEVGRGERDPLDDSLAGISGINNGMRETGFNTYPLDLRALGESGADIPRDAAAVIFARPTSDLSDDEIAVLDRYLARGGSLMLLTDVLTTENPFLKEAGAFNRYLWENFGIRALDLAVVALNPGAAAGSPLDVIGAVAFTDTSIGARLRPETSPTQFRVARAVEVDLQRDFQDVAVGQIIATTPESYGETDWTALTQSNTYRYDDGVDIPGPFSLVVWSWNQTTNARIFLAGDSDWVSNGLILAGDNGVLFTDALSWLVSYGERIGFGFRGYVTGLPLILASQEQAYLFAFLTIVLLPGLVLLTGVLVWWRRARQ